MHGHVVKHYRSMRARLVIRRWRWRRLALPQIGLRRNLSCRVEPVDRLPYERNSLIDASSDLDSEFLEALGSKCTCRPLCGNRQQRRHGKMEPRVKGNRLIRDPEIAIELFNLTCLLYTSDAADE